MKNKFILGKGRTWIYFFLITFLAVVALSLFDLRSVFAPLTIWVYQWEVRYHQWLKQNPLQHPGLLLGFAFLGGLISSISPCRLSLLSVNLGYLGTQNLKSWRDVLPRVGAFVGGVVLVLSLLGLVSSFAGAVLVQYRGFISVTVGVFIILMGLSLLDILRLPLPQIHWHKTAIAGPFGVGVAFALVSAPCSSPVLLAVLTAAAATGSQVQSVLTMVSYALGSTALICLASLFAGIAKQSRVLLRYSQTILIGGAALLMVMGGYYLMDGYRWLFLVYGKGV